MNLIEALPQELKIAMIIICVFMIGLGFFVLYAMSVSRNIRKGE